MTNTAASKRGDALKNAGREEIIDQTTGKFKAPGEPDKPLVHPDQPPGTVMDSNNPYKDDGEQEEFIPEETPSAVRRREDVDEDEEEEDSEEDSDDGLDDLTFDELKAEAKKRDVDTTGLNTKAKLVAALRAA